MKKEIRQTTESPAVDKESRRVEGYAALFNSSSVPLVDWDGTFTETIAPGAFDGVAEVSDVKCLLNHDTSRGLLARARNGKGSLSLTVDERGLKYAFDAPKTALGDELLEGIRRGDISGSSFAFTVAKDTWEKLSDGTYARTIDKVERLYDVSPVYDPAYPETTVDARGLEELRSAEKSEAEKCSTKMSNRTDETKALYL